MDIVLILLAGLFILVGIVGSIVPGVPGPPLGYIGLLLLHFSSKVEYSTSFLVIWAVVVVIILLLDNLFPLWTTKKFGGSKWGVTGSVIGLIAGMIFTPIGMIMGSLIGAIVGELIYSKDFKLSLKAGFGAFIGFLSTIGMKLVLCIMFVIYYIQAIIDLF